MNERPTDELAADGPKNRRGRPKAGVHELHERDAPDGLTVRQRRVLETIRDAI